MVRQIFIPTKENNVITIPREWYGQTVEVIAFPLSDNIQPCKEESMFERRKKLDVLLDKYSMDLSNFKFDRDEANNYD
jgi:hypothetical protein